MRSAGLHHVLTPILVKSLLRLVWIREVECSWNILKFTREESKTRARISTDMVVTETGCRGLERCLAKVNSTPLFSGARHWLNFKATFRMWLTVAAILLSVRVNGRESWLAHRPPAGQPIPSPCSLPVNSTSACHPASPTAVARRRGPASRLVRGASYAPCVLRTLSRIAIKPHSDGGLKSSR